MKMDWRWRRDVIDRLEGFPYRGELLQGLDRAILKRGARRSGTTTLLSLQTIAIAIQYPNTPIAIIDHHGSRQCDRNMASRINEIVVRAALTRVTVLMTGPSSPCVIFHPDREEP